MAFKVDELCGKLLNQVVAVTGQEKSQRKFLKLAETWTEGKTAFKSKETRERMRSDIRISRCPVYTCPKSTGTSGWSTFEIVFEQLRSSVAYCSGQRTLQSFSCRRKAIRSWDIRISESIRIRVKRSLKVEAHCANFCLFRREAQGVGFKWNKFLFVSLGFCKLLWCPFLPQ